MQETAEAKPNSATGSASEAAIIHCSSLSELRCSVCTAAPTLRRSLLQTFRRNKVGEAELPGSPDGAQRNPGLSRNQVALSRIALRSLPATRLLYRTSSIPIDQLIIDSSAAIFGQ